MNIKSLHTQLFNTTDNVYAVIDGASLPALLGKLEEFEPENTCLFRGELPFDLAEAAPYLTRLKKGDKFSEWLLDEATKRPCCIFSYVDRDKSFHALRKHFRSLLKVSLPDNRIVHFRFYDPRVISTFVSNPDEVLVGIMGDFLNNISFIDDEQLIST